MLDTLLVALIISVDTAQVKEFPQKAEVSFDFTFYLPVVVCFDEIPTSCVFND